MLKIVLFFILTFNALSLFAVRFSDDWSSPSSNEELATKFSKSILDVRPANGHLNDAIMLLNQWNFNLPSVNIHKANNTTVNANIQVIDLFAETIISQFLPSLQKQAYADYFYNKNVNFIPLQNFIPFQSTGRIDNNINVIKSLDSELINRFLKLNTLILDFHFQKDILTREHFTITDPEELKNTKIQKAFIDTNIVLRAVHKVYYAIVLQDLMSKLNSKIFESEIQKLTNSELKSSLIDILEMSKKETFSSDALMQWKKILPLEANTNINPEKAQELYEILVLIYENTRVKSDFSSKLTTNKRLLRRYMQDDILSKMDSSELMNLKAELKLIPLAQETISELQNSENSNSSTSNVCHAAFGRKK